MNFKTGCVPDSKDLRDWEYDHIALSSPTPFNWDQGYDVEAQLWMNVPVKDQDGSSSCVGQATATYAWVLDAFEMKKFFTNMPSPELSAKSVYSQINLGFKQGAFLRDGVKLMCNYGINQERRVPGENTDERHMVDLSWMTEDLRHKAQEYIGKEYRVVRARYSIDMCAQAIKDGKGLLFGLHGANNGSWYTAFPQSEINREWAHALYAGKAKIINGRKYIGVMNSWGRNVGESGWQWIGEEFFTKGLIFNPWLLVDLYPGLKLSVSVFFPIGDQAGQNGKMGFGGFARLRLSI